MLRVTTVIPRAIIGRSNRSGKPLTMTAMTVQPMDEQAAMYPAVSAETPWMAVTRRGPNAVTAMVAMHIDRIMSIAAPAGRRGSNGRRGRSRASPACPSSRRKAIRQNKPAASDGTVRGIDTSTPPKAIRTTPRHSSARRPTGNTGALAVDGAMLAPRRRTIQRASANAWQAKKAKPQRQVAACTKNPPTSGPAKAETPQTVETAAIARAV